MKPTNNNEEIFPRDKCGNHAQPPVKTESRKSIIIHDRSGDAEGYYVQLTDDQIKFLDYLIKEYIIDGNYEVIESHTFQVI